MAVVSIDELKAQLLGPDSGVQVGCDGASLTALFQVIDLLTAKATAAAGEFDAAEGWDLDAATSLWAWLGYHASMTRGDARKRARAAQVLRKLPVTLAAWERLELSGGQVAVILANLTPRTIGLFAEAEADLVPTLVGLTVPETAAVMRHWRACAEALTDPDDEAEEPERRLSHSQTLDGRWYLNGGFDPEAGEVIDKALRQAERADDPDEARDPARRRADALLDICRRSLDWPEKPPRGRERPHLNVILDHDDVAGEGQGRFEDGTPIGAESVRRLLCDAAIHRLFVAGRSVILDYGSANRAVKADVWATLVLRDGGCRVPWCDRPPTWCEAHHVKHWADGGETHPRNLLMLCSWHHHRLHQPGWRLRLEPDGTLHITDPKGRSTTSRPALQLPRPGGKRGPRRRGPGQRRGRGRARSSRADDGEVPLTT